MLRLTALLLINILLGPYWAISLLILTVIIQNYRKLVLVACFGAILFLFDGALFGFSPRVAIYLASLLILSTGTLKLHLRRKALRRIFIFILCLLISIGFTELRYLIPNTDYLFAANLVSLPRFSFILGIFAGIFIWERLLVDLSLLMLGISNRFSFKFGVVLALMFPFVGALYSFIPILADTSIQARFRALGFVLVECISDVNILLIGKGFVVRDGYFWPGDIGLFGSIYELGLIRLGILLTFGLSLYKYRRYEMPQFNRFVYGYLLFNYVGKLPTGFIWFL